MRPFVVSAAFVRLSVGAMSRIEWLGFRRRLLVVAGPKTTRSGQSAVSEAAVQTGTTHLVGPDPRCVL